MDTKKPNGFSAMQTKIEVHKVLNKEQEELPAISSIHRINSVHDFYNKLSRDEEINFCAKFGLLSDGQAEPCPRNAHSRR